MHDVELFTSYITNLTSKYKKHGKRIDKSQAAEKRADGS